MGGGAHNTLQNPGYSGPEDQQPQDDQLSPTVTPTTRTPPHLCCIRETRDIGPMDMLRAESCEYRDSSSQPGVVRHDHYRVYSAVAGCYHRSHCGAIHHATYTAFS